MAKKKYVEIGLKEKISLKDLEELLEGFEERIRRNLEKRARRRLEELDILVKADYRDGEFTVEVDIRAIGRLVAPFSYDELLAEALSDASTWLERKLRERVQEANRRIT